MKYLAKSKKFESTASIIEIDVIEKSPSNKFWKIYNLSSNSKIAFWIDSNDFTIIECLDTQSLWNDMAKIKPLKIDPSNYEVPEVPYDNKHSSAYKTKFQTKTNWSAAINEHCDTQKHWSTNVNPKCIDWKKIKDDYEFNYIVNFK